MIKPKDPRELAETLLSRSNCAVQVASVLEDDYGIHSWGWNSSGNGYGMHAEKHCLMRVNPNRAYESTIYVAARRKRNGHIVTAKPCAECQQLLTKYAIRVFYRDKDGVWK